MTRDLPERFGGIVAEVPVHGGTLQAEALGDGPPVLLVHGWTLDRRVWRPQVEALAARFRVIAWDRRGFGRSTAPPDLLREPDDLAAVADAFGAERFALVGMSQGARVALAFAGRHPERVSAIAVQGAPLSDVDSGDGEDEAAPGAEMTRLAAAGEFAAMRRLWRAHPLLDVNGAQASRALDAIIGDYAARDLLAPGLPLDVTTADLTRLTMPILAITGSDEPVWRHKVADRLARMVQATRLDITEAGHLCNLCRPDFYNQALIGFLQSALTPA
ncbi:alpha/beta hydrolase [Sphingomonas sp. ZT3P38]|uniref:alpha/beta fold hydrolase n=1 Tax=Parasphingomonas zepuensis TaxID=3096161 RepID=UPI002FCB47C2